MSSRRKFTEHSPHRIWWTRARVIAGLKRFYADFGVAVTGKRQWEAKTKGTGKKWGPGNPYPSYWSVLSYFASFREAWRAVGVETDHHGSPWTHDEDSVLRASIGCLTRKEIASKLNRTQVAITKRRIKLGLLVRR